MDLLGIAALGGLERITIVAGAVIIGYWGYRLYTAEKNAGLVFMGLAVLVLVGALATGTGHLQRVSEDYQLASLPPAEAQSPAASPFAESPAATPETPAAATAETAAEPPAAELSGAPEPTGAGAAAEATAPASTAAPDPGREMAVDTEALPTAETPPAPIRRLATGQELGGRIVSVKSENVSLEWTPEPESD